MIAYPLTHLSMHAFMRSYNHACIHFCPRLPVRRRLRMRRRYKKYLLPRRKQQQQAIADFVVKLAIERTNERTFLLACHRMKMRHTRTWMLTCPPANIVDPVCCCRHRVLFVCTLFRGDSATVNTLACPPPPHTHTHAHTQNEV